MIQCSKYKLLAIKWFFVFIRNIFPLYKSNDRVVINIRELTYIINISVKWYNYLTLRYGPLYLASCPPFWVQTPSGSKITGLRGGDGRHINDEDFCTYVYPIYFGPPLPLYLPTLPPFVDFFGYTIIVLWTNFLAYNRYRPFFEK